jgi:hypothetical protein
MSVLTNFFNCHDVYIETGIGHGQSLNEAVRYGFKTLHAIEIDEKLVKMAHGTFPRIAELTIHHGSSPDVLPKIIDPARQTLFWLDAHYSAGLYTSDSERDRAQLDPRYGECPLMVELQAIVQVPWVVDPVILIDDAFCFTAEKYEGYYASWHRDQHPTLAEIRSVLARFSVLPRDDGTGEYLVCRRIKRS